MHLELIGQIGFIPRAGSVARAVIGVRMLLARHRAPTDGEISGRQCIGLTGVANRQGRIATAGAEVVASILAGKSQYDRPYYAQNSSQYSQQVQSEISFAMDHTLVGRAAALDVLKS